MDEQTSRDMRTALGCFATGVTIVTTMTDEGPLGMTANSFASVSLDPPLVLWSPARKSKRFPAFEKADYFAIHILSDMQKELSGSFAREGWEPFDGLDFTLGLGDAPLFDDCAARFECKQSAGHDGGDHLILVGEVLRHQCSDLAPLIYHRGGYTKLV